MTVRPKEIYKKLKPDTPVSFFFKKIEYNARVIRDMAKQGNDIIFTTSFGYMDPTLKVAQEFPDIKFEHITGYKRAPNMATGNIRFSEGRYVQGVVAGMMTNSVRVRIRVSL